MTIRCTVLCQRAFKSCGEHNREVQTKLEQFNEY